MKSVVFSGSVKNYEAMQEWAEYLRERSIQVETPKLGKDNDKWDELDDDEQRKQKLEFIKNHNERIDQSDVLFVFNPSGYVGNSTTLEIGYVLAKGKTIYAMQPDDEQGRDVLYSEYCATPELLLEKLKS